MPAAPCILPWAHLRAAFPQLVQGQDRPLWRDALYLGLFYSTFCPGSLSCVPQPRLGPFDGYFEHPVMVAGGISLLSARSLSVPIAVRSSCLLAPLLPAGVRMREREELLEAGWAEKISPLLGISLIPAFQEMTQTLNSKA